MNELLIVGVFLLAFSIGAFHGAILMATDKKFRSWIDAYFGNQELEPFGSCSCSEVGGNECPICHTSFVKVTPELRKHSGC